MSKRDDLTASLAERKQAKPKLYREAANEINAALISGDVAQKRQALMTSADRPRVDLGDLDAVKARTNDFLTACEATATIPTFLGLCTAFGGSREWVYRYLRSHSGTPSAEFLELTRETLADIMMTASMNKAADPATVIFSLKNLHGFADRVEIMPKAEDPGPLGPLADQKALEQRILGTVVLEDDE